MNNFNDYYNYLNNNYNDMNFLADPNSMIYDMNYQALYPNAVMPTNNNILDTKLGFKQALNRFNTYLKKEKELVTLYESKYGPLTTSSPVQTNNWTWNNSPWPWEVQS